MRTGPFHYLSFFATLKVGSPSTAFLIVTRGEALEEPGSEPLRAQIHEKKMFHLQFVFQLARQEQKVGNIAPACSETFGRAYITHANDGISTIKKVFTAT